MSRLYINGDEAKFTKTDSCLVTLDFFDGRHFENLEPRRLFPLSGLKQYIALLKSDGKEIAIIRNLDALIPESALVIKECLHEYYFIPKIIKIYEISEKHGILNWRVETDHGKHEFSVHNPFVNVKRLYDGRVLVRDSNDNRYEIQSIDKMDKKSINLLNNQI